MWQHNYLPIAGNLPLSTLMAAIPLFVLLLLVGDIEETGLDCRPQRFGRRVTGGAPRLRHAGAQSGRSRDLRGAYGLFPIGWIVYGAILLYNVAIDTGKFEIIRDSIGHLTGDRRLQALLIAFAFGAFIEGAAGFGTPIAIAAAILAGLDFRRFTPPPSVWWPIRRRWHSAPSESPSSPWPGSRDFRWTVSARRWDAFALLFRFSFRLT